MHMALVPLVMNIVVRGAVERSQHDFELMMQQIAMNRLMVLSGIQIILNNDLNGKFENVNKLPPLLRKITTLILLFCT